jgi:uncharacterized protein YbjT (DUF2867 family)
LGRRPDKLKDFVQRGAEFVAGSQDDQKYMIRATKDVDALFWVTPPGYGCDDVREFQNRIGQSGAAAIRANKIPRVVNLSSLGANLKSGTGPIGGLYDVENIFNEAAKNVTHLRPGFFFENLFWQLDPIQRAGVISLPLSGDTRFPMIACHDIARVAVQRLTEAKWTGQNVQELHGAADVSFNEVAEALTDVLGKKITYVRCDPKEFRQIMLDNSMSENAADAMLELYDAADSGLIKPTQQRSAKTTTPTNLLEFLHESLLPLIAQPVGR